MNRSISALFVVSLSLNFLLLGCEPPNEAGPAPKTAENADPKVELLPESFEAWTSVPFEGALCGNGTPTALGVNMVEGASTLVLYLEGGGACWDQTTCHSWQTATNVTTGVSAEGLQTLLDTAGSVGIFNRTNLENPMRAANFVYIPYCTGDLHTGNLEDAPHNVAHVGARNLDVFLERIVPTFKNVDRVILSGTSAGGFGVVLNHKRVSDAFPNVVVDAFIDSAPPHGVNIIPANVQEKQLLAWGAEPAECEGCTDLNTLFHHMVNNSPASHFALTTTLGDEVLRGYIALTLGSFSIMPEEDYGNAILDLVDSVADQPNVALFVMPGTGHTFVYDEPYGQTKVAGVRMVDWLRQFVGESDEWGTLLPAVD